MNRLAGFVFLVFVAAAFSVSAQQTGNREAFLKQQAYAEMQRVIGQIDVVQSNVEDLQKRVTRLESSGAAQDLRVEIEALKAAVADLRRAQDEQRKKIVDDLTARLSKYQKLVPKAMPPTPTVVSGDRKVYEVASGDNLYLIAKAFHTTVAKIKALNGLSSDNLKPGQKLVIPED